MAAGILGVIVVPGRACPVPTLNGVGRAKAVKRLENAGSRDSDGLNVLVLNVAADYISEALFARQAELRRACGVPTARPTTDNLLDARVRLGDVAHFSAHPAVVAETARRDDVQQYKLGNRLRLAVRSLQFAPRQQFTCEALAEKPCAAGDQYLHDGRFP
jgi:hypothetical protein